MPKRSSEKKRYVKTACITAALLLCLGGFFIFLIDSLQNSGAQSASSEKFDDEKTYFLANGQLIQTPKVSAKSAILIEASSGEVIFAKNPNERLPMASTTKIMTALVALENYDVNATVSVSAQAVGVEGSSIYLYPEEKLTMSDLLYAMMLESANDAAAAIAIEVGGSIDGFANMMNQKAAALGLENTHFENPHGLDGEAHYTTARELAIIARAAYSCEKFREIVSTYKKTIPLNQTEGVRLLMNHNKLLKGYEGATGIKTGFTKKSGRCLVSAAERDGLTFIAVTLNAPDDWQDHKNMLDCGFSSLEARVLCDKGKFSYILPAVGGDSDHVRAQNVEKITLILPRSAHEIEYVVELPRFVYAPTSSGEVIGRLVFYLNGEIIAESKIITIFPVGKIPAKKSIRDIFKF